MSTILQLSKSALHLSNSVYSGISQMEQLNDYLAPGDVTIVTGKGGINSFFCAAWIHHLSTNTRKRVLVMCSTPRLLNKITHSGLPIYYNDENDGWGDHFVRCNNDAINFHFRCCVETDLPKDIRNHEPDVIFVGGYSDSIIETLKDQARKFHLPIVFFLNGYDSLSLEKFRNSDAQKPIRQNVNVLSASALGDEGETKNKHYKILDSSPLKGGGVTMDFIYSQNQDFKNYLNNAETEVLFLNDVDGDDGELDLSGMPKLRALSFNYVFGFPTINTSNNKELECFECSFCGDFEVDFSHNPKLRYLHKHGPLDVENIDLSENPLLEEIIFYGWGDSEGLKKADIARLSKLKKMSISRLLIDSIDFSGNKELREIEISGCPNIKSLDFSHNPELTHVEIQGCQSIVSIDLSANEKLTDLNICGNKLLNNIIKPNVCNISKLNIAGNGAKHSKTES